MSDLATGMIVGVLYILIILFPTLYYIEYFKEDKAHGHKHDDTDR